MQSTDGKKWNIIIRTEGIREDTLIDAVYSVISQTYENKSIILVCHTSDKSTVDKLEKLAKKLFPLIEIKVLQANRSKKRGHPLNIGLQNCDGEYISFLDDDDIYYPYFGEMLIQTLEENSEYNFAYGISMLVKQKVINSINVTIKKEVLFFEKFNPIKLLAMNYIPNNTYVFRKKDLEEFSFDEDLDLLEDWDYLINMVFANKLKAVFVPKEVSEYRRREDNTNSFEFGENKSPKYLDSIKKIKDKYQNKSINIGYKEIFEIYPDSSGILGINPENAELYRLEKDLDKYKEKSSELHAELTDYFNKFNLLDEKTKNELWLLKRFFKNIVSK